MAWSAAKRTCILGEVFKEGVTLGFMSSLLVISTLVVCAFGSDCRTDNYPECKGDRQSPIDISNMTVVTEAPVYWSYGFFDTPKTMNLTNNGYSVVLTGAGYQNDRLPSLFLNSKRFVLDNVHFHWGKGNRDGTEHTLYGRRFAMEMHAVHRRVSKYGNFLNPEEYLVIAQLFQYTQKSNGFPSGLEHFVNDLGKVVKAGTSTLIEPFCWLDLLRQQSMDYYWYEGSFTTPPCSETVTFLIPRSPSVVTQDEIKKFRELLNENGKPISGNIRPLQKQNGRQIFYFH